MIYTHISQRPTLKERDGTFKRVDEREFNEGPCGWGYRKASKVVKKPRLATAAIHDYLYTSRGEKGSGYLKPQELQL